MLLVTGEGLGRLESPDDDSPRIAIDAWGNGNIDLASRQVWLETHGFTPDLASLQAMALIWVEVDEPKVSCSCGPPLALSMSPEWTLTVQLGRGPEVIFNVSAAPNGLVVDGSLLTEGAQTNRTLDMPWVSPYNNSTHRYTANITMELQFWDANRVHLGESGNLGINWYLAEPRASRL